MPIIVPDIVIFNTIKAILSYIRKEHEDGKADEKTLLYKIFGTQTLQRYGLFKQAKAIITAGPDSPRYLDVNVFFNAQRAPIPTIHITLPSEQTSGSNAIGLDEGYPEDLWDDDAETFQKQFARRFDTTHNIVITSDNINEVLLIYNLLKSMLIATIPHLSMNGLETVRIGGNDVFLNPNIIPPNVFVRAITLSSSYEVIVPELLERETFDEIIFEMGTIIE